MFFYYFKHKMVYFVFYVIVQSVQNQFGIELVYVNFWMSIKLYIDIMAFALDFLLGFKVELLNTNRIEALQK